MKIFIDKQFEDIKRKIEKDTFQDAYNEGYKVGLNKGLIQDREGILLNGGGLYIFKDNKLVSTEVKLLV